MVFGTEALSFAELWGRCENHATDDCDRNVLVITDLSETVLACESGNVPVWGYEHDGLRLSCREIIESLEDLTLSYLLDRYAYTTGRLPFFSDDGLSLYAIGEDEYVELYKRYRQEPYFLRDKQRSYTSDDVRELYRFREAVAAFHPGLGTFRVCPEGCPDDALAYVSACEETVGDAALLTIDFYVLPDFRGMGFGRRSVSLLLHCLRNRLAEETDAGLPAIVHALVHAENEPSRRTLVSLGFRPSSEDLGDIRIYFYDLSEIR